MMPKIASIITVMLLAASSTAHPIEEIKSSAHTGVDIVSYNLVDGKAESNVYYGLQLGDYCCIGICTAGGTLENDAHHYSLDAVNPDNLIIRAEKEVNALITVNKLAGAFDVAQTIEPDVTCIGVRIGNCCFGICVL
ncbi:hypothetical protein BGZ47_007375 [Haplosporangium gracile]|nr:hypothetical protein BGZ47_007375 [Haplosporangium gracile]